MMSAIKWLVRRVTPERLRIWGRERLRWRWFRGHYSTWAAARQASAGYDNQANLDRALSAAKAVRAGQGVWERDGVVFMEPAIHVPLLEALRQAALSNKGQLAVIDIGGAFGSVWWQHRDALRPLAVVAWRVVEQPAFVAAGNLELGDGILRFYPTLTEARAGIASHVALLSSVLPYLEAPKQVLEEAMAAGFEHIIIDRTAFVVRGRDRLVVQHVPPALGGGSYPCWLFNSPHFLAMFSVDYDLVAEWPGFDVVDPEVEFRGFHFRRKPQAGKT